MRCHRAIDEDVDAPEGIDDLLDHRFDFAALAQVDGDGKSAATFLTYFFRSRIGVGLFKIDANNVTAFRGKAGHDGRTKFAVTARDDGYFSFELHVLHRAGCQPAAFN